MFQVWFDIEIEMATSEGQGLALIESRFSEYLEDKQPMYKLILIDQDSDDFDAEVLAENFRNLLEDDTLSVSEKDCINPIICYTTEQEQALGYGQEQSSRFDQVMVKPIDRSALKKLLK